MVTQIFDQLKPYLSFWPQALIGFVTAMLLTPIFGAIAAKYDIYDYPAAMRKKISRIHNPHDRPDRHTHKKPIPLLGGLAVLLPVYAYILLNIGQTPHLIPIALGLTVLIALGIADDRYNLPAKVQLSAQLLAVSLVVITPLEIHSIHIPFDGFINLDLWNWAWHYRFIDLSISLPGDLLLAFILLYSINSIKMVAGSDALLEGNMIIAFLLVFIISLRDPSMHTISAISALIVGAMLGYLPFNFPPAKIFTGSTGKSSYGFLLITLGMLANVKMGTILLIIMLPLIDYMYVLMQRIVVHRPRGLFDLMKINGTDHLHHQLSKMGLSPKQVLLAEVSISLLIGSIAVLSTGALRFFFLIVGSAILLLFIAFLHWKVFLREKQTKKSRHQSPESKYSY